MTVQDIQLLERRLQREKAARKKAEEILEKKSLDLYESNKELKHINEILKQKIEDQNKELNKTQTRLQEIADTVEDTLFNMDHYGNIIFTNRYATLLTGYSYSELLKMNCIELIAPSMRAEMSKKILEFIESNDPFLYLEFQIIGKNKKTIWIGQKTTKSKLDNGQYKFNAIARDISQQIEDRNRLLKAKTLLDENERKYREIIANLSLGLCEIDLAGMITAVDKNFCHLTEYNEEELIGIHAVKVLTDDKGRNVIENEEIKRKQGISSNYTVDIITKSNRTKTVIISGTPKYDENDTIIGSIGIHFDITERLRDKQQIANIQDELHIFKFKYESILQRMQLGVIETSTEGIITKANDYICHLLEYELSNILGKSFNVLIGESLKDDQKLSKLPLDQQIDNAELNIETTSGKNKNVVMSMVPFYDAELKTKGHISVIHDISNQKRLHTNLKEAKLIAENAQKAQKQFLANMSHEMRTPLNAIVGMSHLLKNTDLNSEQEELLDILSSSTSILYSLISDILDMSKIEAGIIEVQSKRFLLQKLLNNLYKTFSIRCKEKELELKLSVDPDIEEYLIGDELLLNQVLINLINNAIKFTDHGYVEIKVDLVKNIHNTQLLKFYVIDTGCGIEKNIQENIFEPFQQKNNTLSTGTGLGLTIIKRLLEILDSEITLVSELGKGSTFSFEMQLAIDSSISDETDHEHENIKQQFENDYKLLVVEDNEMNITYISKLLNLWNLDFEVAKNGKLAVDRCRENSYDLIFMDLQMPVMDGIEATSIIRKELPKYSKVPIIALSASTLLTKKKLALSAGMDDFLAKPYTPKQLLETTRNYLKISISTPHTVVNSIKSGIDQNYLKELYGDDDEYKLEMFELFIERLESNLINLEMHKQSDDFQSIAKLCHKIKPSMAMVGLMDLQSMIEELEHSAKSEDRVKIDHQYRMFTQALDSKKKLVMEEIKLLKRIDE